MVYWNGKRRVKGKYIYCVCQCLLLILCSIWQQIKTISASFTWSNQGVTDFLLLLLRRRRRHQQRRVQREKKPIQEEKNLLISKKKDRTEKKRSRGLEPKKGQRLRRQGKVDIRNAMNLIQPREWWYVAVCSVLCTLIEWLYREQYNESIFTKAIGKRMV